MVDSSNTHHDSKTSVIMPHSSQLVCS